MATPEAGSSTRVSKAAKRPAKTETFSKSLRVALSIFDDEVTTLSDMRETAYETFIVATRQHSQTYGRKSMERISESY